MIRINCSWGLQVSLKDWSSRNKVVLRKVRRIILISDSVNAWRANIQKDAVERVHERMNVKEWFNIKLKNENLMLMTYHAYKVIEELEKKVMQQLRETQMLEISMKKKDWHYAQNRVSSVCWIILTCRYGILWRMIRLFNFPYDDLDRRHVEYQYSKRVLQWDHTRMFPFRHDRSAFIIMDSQMFHVQRWFYRQFLNDEECEWGIRDHTASSKLERADVSKRWKVWSDRLKELFRFLIIKNDVNKTLYCDREDVTENFKVSRKSK